MSIGFVLEEIAPDGTGNMQRAINAVIESIETIKNGGIADIDYLSLGLIWDLIINQIRNKATMKMETKTHYVELTFSDLERLAGELNR